MKGRKEVRKSNVNNTNSIAILLLNQALKVIGIRVILGMAKGLFAQSGGCGKGHGVEERIKEKQGRYGVDGRVRNGG